VLPLAGAAGNAIVCVATVVALGGTATGTVWTLPPPQAARLKAAVQTTHHTLNERMRLA